MSSNFLDVGDIQRLEREVTLDEQLPRQPIEEPEEMPEERNSLREMILDRMFEVLKGRSL
jgi:hypothetical protein